MQMNLFRALLCQQSCRAPSHRRCISLRFAGLLWIALLRGSLTWFIYKNLLPKLCTPKFTKWTFKTRSLFSPRVPLNFNVWKEAIQRPIIFVSIIHFRITAVSLKTIFAFVCAKEIAIKERNRSFTPSRQKKPQHTRIIRERFLFDDNFPPLHCSFFWPIPWIGGLAEAWRTSQVISEVREISSCKSEYHTSHWYQLDGRANWSFCDPNGSCRN